MRRYPQVVSEVERVLRQATQGHRGFVVAVSGGADSVALLRSLIDLDYGSKGRCLVIAHLNHQLRGEESLGDEEFVRDLHRCLTPLRPDLRLSCERLDVSALADERRSNLESTARQVRYEWLARIARMEDVKYVVTGHTADDQAETVLHRVLRGTGLRGLRGIARHRPLDEGVELLRPLLSVRRRDLLAYLADLNQTYREDSSNRDLVFTRNRLRHELLPHLMAHYNPEILRSLCQLASQADELYEEQESAALALLTSAERPRAGAVLVLDRAVFAVAPRSLVREALRLVWMREAWPQGEMGFADWGRLTCVALGELRAVDLPGGVRARLRGEVVQVFRAREQP